ncbi:MAG: ATP-dependent helicase HrpB [Alphaproteobacteria bacterium]
MFSDPIICALPAFAQQQKFADLLQQHPQLIVEAPPGAGKTTLLPLALLQAEWLAGRRIALLLPRRVAARAAARRMASLLGQEVGQQIGYTTRSERKVSSQTIIEVMTEGVLTRQLLDDPSLAHIAAIIFDEFHERSIHADLGLALALESQQALRDDLRLIVMSATLDGIDLQRLMPHAARLAIDGKAHPVEKWHWLLPPENLPVRIEKAIIKALPITEGSLLVFLPGEGEIRETMRRLQQRNDGAWLILPLYGQLSEKEQDSVFHPASAGQRKIILSTSLAESSLTIPDIRVVIDSGIARSGRFDHITCLQQLQTHPIALSNAAQRGGRAGRVAAGVNIRLWPEAEERAMPVQPVAEIEQADLTPLRLALAVWGCNKASDVPWLTPPPLPAWQNSTHILQQLGGLDDEHKLTDYGKKLASMPIHPRLAHLLLCAMERGEVATGVALVALLTERDFLRFPKGAHQADIGLRLELLQTTQQVGHHDASVDKGRLQAVRTEMKRWAYLLGKKEINIQSINAEAAALLLALSFSERLGSRREGGKTTYRLLCGRGGRLENNDQLAGSDFLMVADGGGLQQDVQISLALPLTLNQLEKLYKNQLQKTEEALWNGEKFQLARRLLLQGKLLQERCLPLPSGLDIAPALMGYIREKGIGVLAMDEEALSLIGRLNYCRQHYPQQADILPDFSEQALLADDWLLPHLQGIKKTEELAKLPMATLLEQRLDYQQKKLLEQLTPAFIVLANSGRRFAVQINDHGTPLLRLRMQELYGLKNHPLYGGKPILLEILSPAGRLLQTTADVVGFWQGSYPAIRGEMRGRYPKHPWPDDPANSTPPPPRIKK